MSATVIILPVAAKIEASGAEEVAVAVRLPRRVFGRLSKLAAQWEIPLEAAATLMLTDKINERAGVKR